jgi:hypothetical protein
MDHMLRDLKKQFLATHEMVGLAVQNCPDKFWDRIFGDDAPFCREVYHAVYYLRNLACLPGEAVTRMPFGVDEDPTFKNKQQRIIPRADIVKYLEMARAHLDQLFDVLTIEALGTEDSRFGTYFGRLLYGLRHTQHHAGKLTGYLFCNGIDYDPWRG